MTCEHTRSRYEQVHVYDDYDSGEPVYERKWVSHSTLEDIDLHRMQCSQCGAIEYYSGAAKNFYEKGIDNGLFGKESQ